MIHYGTNTIGTHATIHEKVILGFPSRERADETDFPGTTLGSNATIRPGTTIYSDVTIGDNFQTGHNVLIREKTTIGDNSSVGTATVIDGNCMIGDDVSIQSMVYIPTDTTIGNGVFIGPNAVLTNDPYPPSSGELNGPVICDRASIGANTTILPGVIIGEGALVAAGSIVTKDVPPGMLTIGSPAVLRKLPEEFSR